MTEHNTAHNPAQMPRERGSEGARERGVEAERQRGREAERLKHAQTPEWFPYYRTNYVHKLRGREGVLTKRAHLHRLYSFLDRGLDHLRRRLRKPRRTVGVLAVPFPLLPTLPIVLHPLPSDRPSPTQCARGRA